MVIFITVTCKCKRAGCAVGAKIITDISVLKFGLGLLSVRGIKLAPDKCRQGIKFVTDNTWPKF